MSTVGFLLYFTKGNGALRISKEAQEAAIGAAVERGLSNGLSTVIAAERRRELHKLALRAVLDELHKVVDFDTPEHTNHW